MPVTPNQAPSSTQSMDLSIERVKSSIPKGGTDTETWTYPSPQMVCSFFDLSCIMHHIHYVCYNSILLFLPLIILSMIHCFYLRLNQSMPYT